MMLQVVRIEPLRNSQYAYRYLEEEKGEEKGEYNEDKEGNEGAET